MFVWNFSLILEGFGKSEGDRGHVDEFIYLVDDQIQFVEERMASFKGKKVFLLGEAMSGLVAIQSAQRKPQLFDGVILSNVFLGLDQPFHPWISFFIQKASEYVPKLPLFPASVENWYSSDVDAVKQWESDELAFHGWLRARYIADIQKTAEKVLKDAKHLSFPFLALVGEADPLSHVVGTKQLMEEAGSMDKTVKRYPEAKKSLFADTKKEKVIVDVMEWLNKQQSK